MINRYTVIGQPIAHSLSPEIHALFGELTQRRISYTRTEASPEGFEEAVRAFQQAGGKGCNVTLPHKERALTVCDCLHASAEIAGAVNTIHMQRDGRLVGYNTDGKGLVADLSAGLQVPIEGRRILMLGAGGAARGVLGPLLERAPAEIMLLNRTEEKARALADRFTEFGSIHALPCTADLADLTPVDIVINATSMSLQGEVPSLDELTLDDDALVYDMMYAREDTPFVNWGKSRGVRAVHGYGMLVQQAAESFFVWEGVRPKVRMARKRFAAILANSH